MSNQFKFPKRVAPTIEAFIWRAFIHLSGMVEQSSHLREGVPPLCLYAKLNKQGIAVNACAIGGAMREQDARQARDGVGTLLKSRPNVASRSPFKLGDYYIELNMLQGIHDNTFEPEARKKALAIFKERYEDILKKGELDELNDRARYGEL